MYLKSIEVHGFKSFANKILLDFHNGITGIVGPNGSGKSNVADAVRWVLGEQSAKQLRGASMQDVIFAGTENRKALSYAYVAITMDNSDHKLAVEFEEVTVARRVYRSGESEYLINGSPCRLKDVHELFYDTGIGKEGYSIIGQGQIDKILNGRPEERRELFDEAAGIVKYKRRKATAQKKLENERENLVRVNDILGELERQVGPLEQQAQKAREYLKKKEELKAYDVNMFLLEMEQVTKQIGEAQKNYKIAEHQQAKTKEEFEKIKKDYEQMERAMEQMDTQINEARDSLSNSSLLKGKLEGQINVLKEQIRAANMSDEHFSGRMEALQKEKAERISQKEGYEKEKAEFEAQLDKITARKEKAKAELKALQQEITHCNEGIESGKNEIIELLNHKASVKARQQRYATMSEQINIRKAQLNKRLLEQKSEESGMDAVLEGYEAEFQAAEAKLLELKQQEQSFLQKEQEWKQKANDAAANRETDTTRYHKTSSRLESLKNIAERYDGYGNSIKRVMEQREKEPGLLGVVSDLIKVEKKYETAIETALGGSIQNIVTTDEQTAKKMISYLKQNRYGRATFLPLTSVGTKREFKNQEAMKEPGVIGRADTLVKREERYAGIANYLLGRVIVVETVDHAIALSRKYHYTLNIVTLEGEQFRPGGSMTGGAFKNTGNLLGRKREIEDLEKELEDLKSALASHKMRIEEIKTARALLEEEAQEVKEALQKQYIVQNTAKMNVERLRQQKAESGQVYRNIQSESSEIEKQLKEISTEREKAAQEMEFAQKREAEIEEENKSFQKLLEEHLYREDGANKAVSEIQLEEANVSQKAEFVLLNLSRVNEEIQKAEMEMESLTKDVLTAKEDAKDKERQIEEIKKTIAAKDSDYGRLEEKLKESMEKKEELSSNYKGFFQKREEAANRMNELDKELYRLDGQREKLEEIRENQTNYMWEEYELTLHNAMELRNEAFDNLAGLKKQISVLKEEIRRLGDVNVNAIDEFKELSERYTFLKTQHDDLVEAEETLIGIIEELDTGMRRQFSEKFAEIQREFDKAFKELFGGGKGTLELVEDEDILECGIRIIAQPPGKKLQNMMQLSGGEKSLTAIALLFAIQHLKPSPFCLLDEIEAALDDSNVGRFAEYLHKLTKHTQFIVITHRRGTMAAADRLYGITMQEKGVSTLVSVNLIEHDLDK